MLSINTGPMSNEICDNGQPVFFLPNSTNVFQRMKNKQREAVPEFHDVVDLDETKAKFVAALIAQIFPKQTFISDPPFQHITINLKTPYDGGNGTSSSYNKLGRLPTVRKFLLNAGNSIVDTMSKAGSTVTSTFNTIVGLPGQILSAAMSVFYALIALGALYAIIKCTKLISKCIKKKKSNSAPTLPLSTSHWREEAPINLSQQMTPTSQQFVAAAPLQYNDPFQDVDAEITPMSVHLANLHFSSLPEED